MPTDTPRMFPLLPRTTACLKAVPWGFVAPHAVQAQRTHGQTLERLAERHGLAPQELLAVLEDQSIFTGTYRDMTDDDAEQQILVLLGRWLECA